MDVEFVNLPVANSGKFNFLTQAREIKEWVAPQLFKMVHGIPSYSTGSAKVNTIGLDFDV